MALPDTIGLKAGTAISWTSSGGTYAVTLTNLANDAGREGAKGDLGVNWARQWNVLFESKPVSAPTDGVHLELYWCQSTNATAGTDNPGNLTGADAAVTSPDQTKRQLTYLGPLVISNALGAVVQRQRFDLFPLCRYGFPIVVNKTGVALSATGTDHKVTLTPAIDEVID